jgi:DNA-directed RNA polymerase specialized sigma24 family protein
MIGADELPFADLVAQLRAGDPHAAALIFQEYGRRLLGLASQRLAGRLAGKASPDSVVQSVFETFFRRCRENAFDLKDSHSLWSLLARITLNKCGHRFDYWFADCRNPDREQVRIDMTDSTAPWEAIARDPTPDEAAQLEETMALALEGLREVDCRILELSLQGQEIPAIAAAVGCGRRTVERSLERVRLRLERMRDEEP